MLRDSELYRSDLHAACEGAAQSGALNGKRVLLTGATGLIGSFLAEALLYMNEAYGANIRVWVAGRSEAGVKRRFGAALDGKTLVYAPYDATRHIDFDFDADIVIHAACSAHPMAYATDPVGVMQANVFGTMQLIEYLRARPGAKLIFLSTGETYGENPDLPEGFSETDHGYIDPMNPRACYPESKRAAETLIACGVKQYGIDARVARLCHVYGPTFTESNSRADAQFLRNALRGEDIVMKSTGAQVRSYCYVADAASAILTLLEKGEPGQAYNVANRNSTASIREYAETLAEAAGVLLRFELPPEVERAGYTRVTRAVLNPAKLEALGWRPRFDLKTGLEHTLECARG